MCGNEKEIRMGTLVKRDKEPTVAQRSKAWERRVSSDGANVGGPLVSMG